ncbi:kinesin-like protein KIN-7N isoform X4 [Raphanus sativus]|uniref:Kinesin-like protein KIN-7N isoform X4 n=1 Tax=Raphanus sativus TaxID=3726 RepID=A0A9W3BST0_RAPSA|nr:kinesin-like protein KIN-7N isoform X4 [Raphanus sativus]
MEKISVAVRVRPRTPDSSLEVFCVESGRQSYLSLSLAVASYSFDHVFDECVRLRASYQRHHSCRRRGFQWYCVCLWTGSETDPGIIRRSVRDISDREFLIRVSYMEIYNEEINDLLAVENQRLQIHEHWERGVFVACLKEEIVNDAEQIQKLLDSGEGFKAKANLFVLL